MAAHALCRCSEDLSPDCLTVFCITCKREPASQLKFCFLQTTMGGCSNRRVLELPHTCARHCLTPHSVASCGQLEISHGGSVHTMEIGKHYRLRSPPPSQASSPSDHWLPDILALLGKDETFGRSSSFPKYIKETSIQMGKL